MNSKTVEGAKVVDIPIQSPNHINAAPIRIMRDMGFRWNHICAWTPQDSKISAEALCEILCMQKEHKSDQNQYARSRLVYSARRRELEIDTVHMWIKVTCLNCKKEKRNRMCRRCDCILYCTSCVKTVKVCSICGMDLRYVTKIYYG